MPYKASHLTVHSWRGGTLARPDFAKTCVQVAPSYCWKIWPAWLLGRELPLVDRSADDMQRYGNASRFKYMQPHHRRIRLFSPHGWSEERFVPLCIVTSDRLEAEGDVHFAAVMLHSSSGVGNRLSTQTLGHTGSCSTSELPCGVSLCSSLAW